MANGGGSINLRLSLKGAEQVRSELQSIGPAGSKMARELDRAMRQPSSSMSALNAAAGQARTGLDNLAGRTGPLGAGLSTLGPVGLAAAAGFGALAIGLQQAREAMGWAADLTDVSDRIGVTTEALQGWRFVADEAGVSTMSLEANMEKLNSTLGAFKSGVGDAKLRPVFESLGITPQDLENVETADQMLLLLAGTLGEVQDRAVQVKFAKSLGVEESLPIIRLGAERIRELTEEAEKLGLVTGGDVVAAFDAADRQMEIAQQRIDASLRLSVSGLAEDFADVVSAIAAVIGWLVKLDQQIANFSGGGDGSKPLNRGVLGWASDTLRGRSGADGDAARDQGLLNQPGWQQFFFSGGSQRRRYLERQRSWVAGMSADMNDLVNGTGEFGPKKPGWERHERPTRGGGPSAAERQAERRRQEAEREIERLRVEELRAADDFQRRQMRDGETPQIRAEAARLLAESQRAQEDWAAQQRRKIIEDAGLWDEETAARAGNLQGLQDLARLTEERRRVEQEDKDRAEALQRAEDVHLSLTSDILSIASSAARTAEDRRQIERQLLEIAQRRQRADLEAAIAAEREPQARARMVEALARLPQLFEAQARDVDQRNAGPLGRWWDAQPQSPAEVTEGLTAGALDALDGLNGGLIDVYKNARSASEAFDMMGDVGMRALQGIVDSLLEVAIQTLIVRPLVSGLFGDPKGGGGILGSFLGNMAGSLPGFGKGYSLSSTKAPAAAVKAGRAWGGLNGSRGLLPVGERGMELVDLPVGSRVYDTERSERMMLAMGRGPSQGYAPTPAPVVKLTANVINRTSEPVQARVRQTPEGLDVILEPMVRNAVNRMGSDGSLAKANALTPAGTRR